MGQYLTELSNSNCTMQYTSGADARTLLARCDQVGHSLAVIATESQARTTRGFYPMQRAVGPFTVRLELKGNREFEACMAFLEGYARSLMSAANAMPLMWVSVPSRSFSRLGVPVGGVTHGDHVGSNVFKPVISFESVTDPLAPGDILTGYTGGTAWISEFDPNGQGDDASRFFYPASAASNDPNATGAALYDAPIIPPSRLLPGRGSMRAE